MHQRKWLDGRLFDFPVDRVISWQPITSFHCSSQRNCSQTDVINLFSAMLNDQGQCSALLTREGFFDFNIFRTHCNVPHTVAVVCQHEEKVTTVYSNNMSDIKVLTVNGFYSLHVFASCDIGWFMVDNMCIKLLPQPQKFQ